MARQHVSLEMRIEAVKQVNEKHGNHWFSRDAMRFFKSRVSDRAYKVGDMAYFITSEKNTFAPRGGRTSLNPRKWTIRTIDLTNGKIKTVSKFQEFDTNREAKKQLNKLLSEMIQKDKCPECGAKLSHDDAIHSFCPECDLQDFVEQEQIFEKRFEK